MLKPINPSTGQPAEGDNFFPREKIITKIQRKLNMGENILLSAPRRTGKSSILKHMQKNPQKNQIIKYIIVQSVETEEEFFKKLFNELINDEEIFSGVGGYLKRVGTTLGGYISRIRGVSTEGLSINPHEVIDYYQETIALIKDFLQHEKKILIFIDEFPDAVNNIKNHSPQKAIHFLQQNRDLREMYSDSNLQFLYTGSTGLRNIVKKLDQLDLINDLYNISVSPFSKEEASELIKRLVLGFQQYEKTFCIDDKTIAHLLGKISWLLPYYIQIIVDELFAYHEDTKKSIDATAVDFVLREVVKARSNHSDYFENWKRRLKGALDRKEYDFAIEVLNHIAKNSSITYALYHDKSVKHQIKEDKYILDVLEYDGYISKEEEVYGFNSILLKEWWYINVAT